MKNLQANKTSLDYTEASEKVELGDTCWQFGPSKIAQMPWSAIVDSWKVAAAK